ncbi:cellulose synthase subunit BcsC-related outer membrane protein [Trinickia sp.]|uniref:cellulose synthase subunit BcsC-related outer membrane protein n=1 Tax=Trinickia sp. TaxID=2571163 RepID=UPI003F7CEE53
MKRASKVRAPHAALAPLLLALPVGALAGQANLADVTRAPRAAAEQETLTGQSVVHEGQRDLASRSAAPGRARVTQAPQRNLAAEGEVAPAPVSGSAASIAATPAPLQASAVATSTTADTTSAPDDRPLWQLLQANRLEDYRQALVALQRRFPSWQPAPALAADFARRSRDAQVAQVLAGGDAAAVARLLTQAPDAFGCAHIDRVWRAGEVLAAAGRTGEVVSLYRSVVPACTPARNRMATLYHAEHELPQQEADALIALEAAEGKRDAESEAAFERLRYERAVTQLAAAPADSEEAARQLAALAPSIRARHDAGTATLAGWISLAHRRTDVAGDWFETALAFDRDATDAALGLADVRIEQHAYDEASVLLAGAALRNDPRAREGRARIALAQADEAYRQGHYAQSLGLLDTAEREGARQSDTELPRGWALYALGRYREAASHFSARYARQRDEDSAEGFALAMQASGAPARPAADDAGPLRNYVAALEAERDFYSKQFVESGAALRAALDGPVDAQRVLRRVPADLTGIGAPSISSGLAWGDHVGAAAQGRLNVLAPTVRGEWIDGTRQFELRYRTLFLDAGSASLDETVPGLQSAFDNGKLAAANVDLGRLSAALHTKTLGGTVRADELQAMISDTVRFGADQRLNVELAGGAVQGGPGGLTPGFRAAIGQQAGWGAWSAFFGTGEPVRDSLLSWRGMRLPDGSSWGAVQRTEIGTHSRWQVAPRWNVSASTQLQWLTGMNVMRNFGGSGDVSAAYDLKLQHFDYFSVGPAFHYLGYVRNENFYTWGQGGYYSPQSSLSGGVALQWLSQEGRRWQWQGNVETGWNVSHQSSVPCFPNSLPDGLRNLFQAEVGSNDAAAAQTDFTKAASLTCGGSHAQGPYAHLRLAATFRLSSRWQAGVLGDANVTPGRDKQFAALAFLRYFLSPRAAVFSRDVARSPRDFYLRLDDDHD